MLRRKRRPKTEQKNLIVTLFHVSCHTWVPNSSQANIINSQIAARLQNGRGTTTNKLITEACSVCEFIGIINYIYDEGVACEGC